MLWHRRRHAKLHRNRRNEGNKNDTRLRKFILQNEKKNAPFHENNKKNGWK